MRFRKTILAATVILIIITSSACIAGKPLFESMSGLQPMAWVQTVPDGLFVEPSIETKTLITQVTISTFNGQSILNTRSHGEPIEILSQNLPDGVYYYKINTVYQLDMPMGRGADMETEASSVQSGSFQIINHSAIVPEPEFQESTGFIDDMQTHSLGLLGKLLQYVVADTMAADLSSSSGSPSIYFNDTGETNQGTEWRLRAANGPDGSHNFTLYDDISNQTVMSLNSKANGIGVTTSNSIVVNILGDVSWANAGLFYRRSNQRLAIGANSFSPTLFSSLTIFDGTPDIRLYDESDTSNVELQLANGEMQFWGRTNTTTGVWNNIMNYDTGAPNDSLIIDSTGTLFAQHNLMLGSTSNLLGGEAELSLVDALPIIRSQNTSSNSGLRLRHFRGLQLDMNPSGDGFTWEDSVFSIHEDAPSGTLQADNLGIVSMSKELVIGANTTPPGGVAALTLFNNLPIMRMHNTSTNSGIRFRQFQGLQIDLNPSGDGLTWLNSVFSIDKNAFEDSLRVSASSNVQIKRKLLVGSDTMPPGANQNLILSESAPAIRLSSLATSSGSIITHAAGFRIHLNPGNDGINNVPVFGIADGAPKDSFQISATGKIGLGTNIPNEALHILRTDTASRIQLDSIASAGSNAPQMIWRRARSNAGVPTALLTGDNLGAFSFRGHDGSGYTGSRGFINVQATENWSPSSQGTQMLFQVTKNGTTTPTAVMQITNDGKVFINGTQLNVPDYVFEADYKLMSLDQLASYVEKNKHLPGVASAKEVNNSGLDLGGSQLSLLEKVEELTLYTLQQHEQLKEMQRVKNAHKEVLSAYHAQQDQLKSTQSLLTKQQQQLQSLETRLEEQQQLVNRLLGASEGQSVYTSLK